jgi:hypothetical protein
MSNDDLPQRRKVRRVKYLKRASCKSQKSEFLRRHIRPPGAIFYREREAQELAAELAMEACFVEKVQREQIILHSDNGSPMKGATMLATLQKLGVHSIVQPSLGQ